MVACELARRHPPEAQRCPRCDSSDTKFCYYNNYNTSQPRHFCKSCKRYWTAGGSLRNVPVGGGLRKNKKSKLLNQVKDMVSSSSSDELFQKGSLAQNPPFNFGNDGLAYEAPLPLSFASPLFMATPNASADVAGDGTLANAYAFRNLNPVGYGFFADNRMDDYTAGMDPSLGNPINVRQQAQQQADYGRTLPEGMQRHWNGASHGPHSLAGVDQAQSHSGCVSEVPSEPSQASSNTMREVHTAHSTDLQACHVGKTHASVEDFSKLRREELADVHAVIRQQSVSEQDSTRQQAYGTEELRHVEDNQLRGTSPTEGEDDELGNVVNVRYPYDYEQVSEVLFGGTPDFFQLSGY
ncbi:hypothetical protein L7F22_035326 [Adiantum nelumboides]|nr:hypothetical protein [Adiantum nelumboides]